MNRRKTHYWQMHSTLPCCSLPEEPMRYFDYKTM